MFFLSFCRSSLCFFTDDLGIAKCVESFSAPSTMTLIIMMVIALEPRPPPLESWRCRTERMMKKNTQRYARWSLCAWCVCVAASRVEQGICGGGRGGGRFLGFIFLEREEITNRIMMKSDFDDGLTYFRFSLLFFLFLTWVKHWFWKISLCGGCIEARSVWGGIPKMNRGKSERNADKEVRDFSYRKNSLNQRINWWNMQSSDQPSDETCK